MFGFTLATDMAVEADDAIACAHDHMQIVADHQDGAAELLTHVLDLPVKIRRPWLVQPLCRLIEDQQFRTLQKRTRQKNALKLPPRQLGHLPVGEFRNAGLFQGFADLRLAGPAGQAEKPFHGHRQGRVDMQTLRHITDTQPCSSFDLSRRWCKCSNNGP